MFTKLFTLLPALQNEKLKKIVAQIAIVAITSAVGGYLASQTSDDTVVEVTTPEVK